MARPKGFEPLTSASGGQGSQEPYETNQSFPNWFSLVFAHNCGQRILTVLKLC